MWRNENNSADIFPVSLFKYNNCSEMVSATRGNKSFSYAFDNCGNCPSVMFDNNGGFALPIIGGVGAIGGIGLIGGMLPWIGVAIGVAIVVTVIADELIPVIGNPPMTDDKAEEKENTDAIPIEKCPPCPKKKKRCNDCAPPKGTVMLVAHHTDHPHGGMQPHYHYHKVNQNPLTCTCHENRDVPYTRATLLPNAIPWRPETGGGFAL